MHAKTPFSEGTIDVDRSHDVSVLILRGEHDMGTATQLHTAITEAAKRSSVVVSLDQVTFIDSHIIRTLYRARAEMEHRGHQLVIQDGASATVRRVLDLSGVHQHFHCAETIDEAIVLAADADRRKTRKVR